MMDTVAARFGWTWRVSPAQSERVLLWAFAATIGLSAFLLFAVQPFFARLVLPSLGGSPSVWAVSMCFFQAVLLAGYCYAHLLNRYLTPARAVAVHMVVLIAACLALPIALPAAAATPSQGNTYLWLISILAGGVGLPFFAVSANAPLLQTWFGRTGHAHAADPYFLYGASNIGSLAALLLYPVIAEPLFGLSVQASLWTGGFVALGVSILGCGALMLGRFQTGATASVAPAVSPAPSVARRMRWVALSFVPSALLVAFTTHLTTDVASAPFLWVFPLALFLATFIVVFRERAFVPSRVLEMASPFAAAAVYVTMIATSLVPLWLAGLTGLVAFLLISLLCHRRLYELRPSADRLTEFYLLMSLGGVLGGVFAAMIAPQLFTSIFEFPLLILAGLMVQPRMLWRSRWRRQGTAAAAIVAAGVAVLVVGELLDPQSVAVGKREFALAIAAAAFACAFMERRSPLRQAAFLAVMLVATVLPSEPIGIKYADRSFFGLHRVGETPGGDVRILLHGTTVHGAQRFKNADGSVPARPVPMTYYHPESPMARSLELQEGARRVGIVGLGSGAIACSARPQDTWKFYEIDPAVVKIARHPGLFTYLSQCQPQAPVIVGDARLTLASEQAAAFDYLLIDAFSSDAIPVHLMTVQALDLYFSKLSANGLLTLHVSNRHLDLAPILAANVGQMTGVHGVVVRNHQPSGNRDKIGSVVVLLSRDAALIERARGWPDAKPLVSSGVAAWTDDYSDLLTALVRGFN